MADRIQLPWWKKILFAVIVLGFLLLSIDAALWLLSPSWLVFENHVPLVYEPHETWGYRYRPGARDTYRRYTEIEHEIAIGSHGWRGEPPAIPKPDGVFRVVLIGDSHVAGLEVRDEDVLGEALERHLRAGQPNRQFEVISLGLDGSGTDVQRAILEQEGLRYEPDLVLLQIFRNDFRDVGRPLVYREVVGEHLISYQTPEERAALQEQARSRQGSLLRGLARLSRLARAYRAWRLGKAPDNFLTSGEWYEMRKDWEPLPERVAMVQAEIDGMREAARRGGAGFAMVSIPASWILAKNRDPDQASYPVKLLGLWLREQEIPCLDLWAPIAGGREDPAIYFFRTDSHPNARGYETMAQLLGEWVLNEGLIPEK